VTSQLRKLAKLRLQFHTTANDEKVEAIKKLSSADIDQLSHLINYHDTLCFMRAYPDGPQLARLVESELRAFGQRVLRFTQRKDDAGAAQLMNSGLVNSTTVHPFGYDLTCLLLKRYPQSMELDWSANNETLNDRLLDTLPLLVAWQENDALGLDCDVQAADWLKRADGNREGPLLTFVRLLESSGLPHPVQEHLFENLQMEITWRLGRSQASRTLARWPAGRKFYQRTVLRVRTNDLRAELVDTAAPLKLAGRPEGTKLVQVINEAMAVRNRELLPITSANPDEVYLYRPGRGLMIALFGMHPDSRLPLESNFGALLVRNGMPIGYGVAATLFDRVEIAINVFPEQRSGESSYIFEQFFRLFYHHFGSRAFVVRKRQMGYGEDEALHSGAFWFYYKLGFRALDHTVRSLAEKEHDKQRRRHGYRTPLSIMHKLSVSDVLFHADPAQMDNWRDMSTENLAYVVTDYFARKHRGDRQRGAGRAKDTVSKALDLTGLSEWSLRELDGFKRLAPLLASIPKLESWNAQDKADLVRIIRAKPGPHERSFVLLCATHARLKLAIEKLAATRSL